MDDHAKRMADIDAAHQKRMAEIEKRAADIGKDVAETKKRMDEFDRRAEERDKRFYRNLAASKEEWLRRAALADKRMDKFDAQLQDTSYPVSQLNAHGHYSRRACSDSTRMLVIPSRNSR